MTAGVRHLHEAGSWTPKHTRRAVEASDIEYCGQRFPRQGWQALGKQLGLNSGDLRRACEDAWTASVKATPTRASAARLVVPALTLAKPRHLLRLKPFSRESRVLQAVAVGCRNHDEVQAFAEVTRTSSTTYVGRLKAQRFIDGREPDGRWKLTLDGWAEVAALIQAEENADG